jgi:hypothetical protein
MLAAVRSRFRRGVVSMRRFGAARKKSLRKRLGRREAAGRLYQDRMSSGSGMVSLTISQRMTCSPQLSGFAMPHCDSVFTQESYDKIFAITANRYLSAKRKGIPSEGLDRVKCGHLCHSPPCFVLGSR